MKPLQSCLILMTLAATVVRCRVASKPPISGADLKLLFDDDKAEVAIFDFRKRVDRETDGFISSSFPLPEEARLETLEAFKL